MTNHSTVGRERGELTMTPPMIRFTDYFGELGPRWGLSSETCRLHALLYLVGRPLTQAEIAALLELDDRAARDAIDDLVEWGMADGTDGTAWSVSGEPWDLLFSALEERQRREMGPALEMLDSCLAEARADHQTSRSVTGRIERLQDLIQSLAALASQSGRFSPHTLGRLAGMGGLAARLLNRALPPAPSGRTSSE
ncbi:MAG: hypothetical protein AAF495_15455 [Pseudomonadota bacterium]